ncbi:MAG: S1C family serine protease [Phycisphaerae bacterium]
MPMSSTQQSLHKRHPLVAGPACLAITIRQHLGLAIAALVLVGFMSGIRRAYADTVTATTASPAGSSSLAAQLTAETRKIRQELSKSMVLVVPNPNPDDILPDNLCREFRSWKINFIRRHGFFASHHPQHGKQFTTPGVSIVPQNIWDHQSQSKQSGESDQVAKRLADLRHNPRAELFLLKRFLITLNQEDRPAPWQIWRVVNNRIALLQHGPREPLAGIVVENPDRVLVLTAIAGPQSKQTVKVILPDGRNVTARILGSDYIHNLTMLKLPTEAATSPLPLSHQMMRAAAALVAVPIKHPHNDWILLPNTQNSRMADFDSRGNRMRRTLPRRIYAPLNDPAFLLDFSGRLVGFSGNGRLVNLAHMRRGFLAFVRTGNWPTVSFGIKYTQVSLNDPLRQQWPALGNQGAVRVDKVLKNSPAQAAGIRPGDIITRIDGVPIRFFAHVMDRVSDNPSRVRITLLRDGRHKKLLADLSQHRRPPSAYSHNADSRPDKRQK